MAESTSTTQPGAFDVVGAGQYIGLGRTSTYDLIRTGQLRVVKVGRRTIVPRSELDAFLARQLDATSSDPNPAA